MSVDTHKHGTSRDRSNWSAQARADMADAKRATAEMERQERERRKSNAPSKEEIRRRREAIRAARSERFDQLKAGDSLEPFGLCASVHKKNAKSVITTMGSKWTKKELCG